MKFDAVGCRGPQGADRRSMQYQCWMYFIQNYIFIS